MAEDYGDILAQKVAKRIAPPVATLAAIDAIPADSRTAGMGVDCTLSTDPSAWLFVADSVAVASVNVRVPSDNPAAGRWHRKNSSATLSSGKVRNVVVANVANLAAYTVASATLNDNVSGGNVANDRVLLVGQTTPSENGPWIVGTVAAGTAPLTRPADWTAGSVILPGSEFLVTEGTVFGNRKWFASLVTAITVGTSSPAFYPRKYERITTAMAGTPGIKALSAEWILSTTKSTVLPTVKVPGTQGFLSIGALTAGAGGGSFTVTSTANETSTLQIVIEN